MGGRGGRRKKKGESGVGWDERCCFCRALFTLSDQTPSHNQRGQGRGELWNARGERIQVCAELERREMGGGGGGGDYSIWC